MMFDLLINLAATTIIWSVALIFVGVTALIIILVFWSITGWVKEMFN